MADDSWLEALGLEAAWVEALLGCSPPLEQAANKSEANNPKMNGFFFMGSIIARA